MEQDQIAPRTTGGRRRGSSRVEAETETAPTLELRVNDEASETETEDDNTRQFVTFKVGNEVFGIPIFELQEIIRLPEVTRVPLSSANLKGLSNLRGKTLPIISLQRIFGLPESEPDDATRVLVIQHESLLGFVVDQVASVLSVELSQIEGVEAIEATINTEYLTGIIKDGSGKMVMILNFEQLIEAHFRLGNAGSQVRQSEAEALTLAGDEEEDTDTLHFVSFTVEGQEYAIPIEHVQEIVQIPKNIAQVPNSPFHTLGVINLRDRLLALVSLRQLFSLPMQPLSEQNRIVVVQLPNGAVGIVTDTVSEVLRVHRSLVDALPKALAQDGSLVEITAIGRLDGGKRLVSFLSADHLLQHDAVREAVELGGSQETQEVTDELAPDEEDEDEKHVVIFRLGDEEYGVPITSVNEIVRVPDVLTRIPTAPSFIEGIINLRGSVLPVIDQRRRFGMAEVERSERQRIMVFNALGKPTGFIVDSVSEVYKIADDCIERAPHLSTGSNSVIGEVANLQKDKRMILLLDVDKLLDTNESEELVRLAA